MTTTETEQGDTRIIQILRKLPLEIIPHLNKKKGLTQEIVKGLKYLVGLLCDQGYIRTHSFLSTWVKDYTTNGLLAEKDIHGIVDSCPWSWDQTRKYVDLLEKNNFINIESNSDKKKICRLNLSNNEGNPSELQRMLSFYSKFYRTDEFTTRSLDKTLQVYRSCIKKSNEFNNLMKFFNRKSKIISQTTDDENSSFTEQIIRAYSEIHEEDSQDASVRIIRILAKEPLLFRGLKRKG